MSSIYDKSDPDLEKKMEEQLEKLKSSGVKMEENQENAEQNKPRWMELYQSVNYL